MDTDAAHPAPAARAPRPRLNTVRAHTSLDVHLIPIAREIDRAVLPFLPRKGRPAVLHAHRAILLVPAGGEPRRVAAKVERALQQVMHVERHTLAGEAFRAGAGLHGILHQVSWLCRRELEAGNRVHINLSSGSKLVAFAAGMAGMAHIRPGGGSVYHVQAGSASSEAEVEEHGRTRGIVDVEELDLMPVLLPEPLQLRVLNFLRHAPEGRAGYRDLLRFLQDIPGSTYSVAEAGLPGRRWNNAVTTRMVRAVLTPLAQAGLLEIRDQGRHREAHLTTRGLLYAAMAGLERGELAMPLTAAAPATMRLAV